ncbi:MAG: dihydrolipoyl dehydrogenase [Deltaproteobacteria bacterium]|nr:dihydrolipoyl dehydrogenase [Deltaproteobacteria bacterium]MBW2444795.1 dihydrolipoyl dehydrogenase [Deltaproteobacteria bacterium]
MAAERFDVVVIGSGPGGYVSAIRAAQLGMKAAVIEADRPGGVCLNWGCIPSKALLTGAELIETLRQKGETFGVRAGKLELDYGKVIDHSRKCADRLGKGVQGLLKKNQIEFIAGRGRVAGKTTVEVEGAAPRTLEAAHIVVATGSGELILPGLEVDGDAISTSREALESKRVPERLVIIGAGAVGVEFAYVYANYGSQVTMLEMADQMLPGADPDVAQALQREFRRKKIDVQLGTRFERVKKVNGGVKIDVTRGEESAEIDADHVLVAIGRTPNSAGLGLEEAGIELDRRGFIPVNEKLRTTVSTISAIGDVAGPPLLAHKASEEGVAAMEFLAEVSRPPLDHFKIPGCIYCQPQVAWIGRTEAQARQEFGDEIRVGKFPFTASGKAIATGHTAGFVKIIAEPRYNEIVGAHIIGYGATELVAEMGLAMTLEATTAEVAATSHAHPTLSEAILEAALSAEGRSINF